MHPWHLIHHILMITLLPLYSRRDTILPLTSGRVKSGAVSPTFNLAVVSTCSGVLLSAAVVGTGCVPPEFEIQDGRQIQVNTASKIMPAIFLIRIMTIPISAYFKLFAEFLVDKQLLSGYNRHMPHPKVLITRDKIKKAIARLAEQIRKDYQDKNPLLISVLKGSSIFIADLIREINMPLEIEFVRLSSYGSSKVFSGNVKIVQGLRCSIEGRDVLLIEDIIDTGHSISHLIKYLKSHKPASLKLCALTDKPSRREVPVHIDYLGFTVPDKFIVGYGIDWDEKYRYLPDICVVE